MIEGEAREAYEAHRPRKALDGELSAGPPGELNCEPPGELRCVPVRGELHPCRAVERRLKRNE